MIHQKKNRSHRTSKIVIYKHSTGHLTGLLLLVFCKKGLALASTVSNIRINIIISNKLKYRIFLLKKEKFAYEPSDVAHQVELIPVPIA